MRKVEGSLCSKQDKVPGALCPKRDKVLDALCPTGKALGGRCTTLDTTSRNHNGLSAQGRRVREADPDSRSEAEGLGRAEGPMRGPGEGGVIWWSTAK